MLSYKLSDHGVFRLPENAFIPSDPTNRDWQAYQAWLAEGNEPAPAEDSAQNRESMVVSRFQARAALHLAGLLDQIESIMADPATPILSRLAWQDAQEFRRTSPTIASLAALLNLTEEQLDDLFITAAGIVA